MSAFLDTGFLFAFLHRKDRHHPDAAREMRELLSGAHGTLVTSTMVVAEAFTLLRARGLGPGQSQELARLLGLAHDAPAALPLRILDVGRADMPAIHALFEAHPDHGISFADASTIHLMRTLGIDRVVSFDHGFDGLVPRVPA